MFPLSSFPLLWNWLGPLSLLEKSWGLLFESWSWLSCKDYSKPAPDSFSTPRNTVEAARSMWQNQ